MCDVLQKNLINALRPKGLRQHCDENMQYIVLQKLEIYTSTTRE